MTSLLKMLRFFANLRGVLRLWYLRRLYLPLVQSGQDINKINVRLAQAGSVETRLILEAMGARIDPTAYLETHLLLHNARPDYRHLCVGSHSYVGKDCFFDLRDEITIESNVTMAMRVTVLTHFDAGSSFAGQIYPETSKPVVVRQGAYIGAGVIILPGVTVHQEAIVAAGAVLTEDVPPRTLVGGIPAKAMRSLSPFHKP